MTRRGTLLVYGSVFSEYYGNLVHVRWKILFHMRWDWTHANWHWKQRQKTQKLRTSQNASLTTVELSSYQPSWMAAITINHKKDPITHRVNKENCNKNWTLLSLSQSSNWRRCQPYWNVVITKHSRNGCHSSTMGDFCYGWHLRWLTTC